MPPPEKQSILAAVIVSGVLKQPSVDVVEQSGDALGTDGLVSWRGVAWRRTWTRFGRNYWCAHIMAARGACGKRLSWRMIRRAVVAAHMDALSRLCGVDAAPLPAVRAHACCEQTRGYQLMVAYRDNRFCDCFATHGLRA
jgi:hypothetical protein